MKQRRRKEILHELGLTPIWCCRADNMLNEGAPMTRHVDQAMPVTTATAPENNDRAAQIARQHGSLQLERLNEQGRQLRNTRSNIQTAPSAPHPRDQRLSHAHAETAAGLTF